MIEIVDIKESVNKAIRNNIDIKVLANSVKDNFKSPAIFTDVKAINFNTESRYRQFESYNITVHYFPRNYNDEIEMLKMVSQLRNIFNRKLEIKNRKIDITNIKSTIHEASLFFKFNIGLQQYRDVEKIEVMKKITLEEE